MTFIAESILAPQNWLLFVGLALIVMWLMMRIIQRRKRGHAGPLPSASEQLERMRQARGIKGDMEQIMVEVEQLAKRLSAHLDAKAVHIEKLLEEADERIATLEKLAANGDAAANGTPSAAPSPKPPPPQVAEDPLARKVHQLADTGLDAHRIAAELGEHVGKVELILALRRA